VQNEAIGGWRLVSSAAAERTPSMKDEDVTRTLKGMGPLRGNKCPACHLAREKPPIQADLAVTFGLALVFVRGADSARKALCRRHASLAHVLADEIR
jgi:hypothetical protein